MSENKIIKTTYEYDNGDILIIEVSEGNVVLQSLYQKVCQRIYTRPESIDKVKPNGRRRL